MTNPVGINSIVNTNNDVQALNSTVQSSSSMLEEMGIHPDMILKTVALMPPLLIADKFVNSKIGGKEENSLLKKIANIGDGISRSLGDKSEKISNFIKNNRFIKYFTEDYSALPRSSLAKTVVMPEINIATELSNELISLRSNPKYAKLFEDGNQSLSAEAKSYLLTLDSKNAPKETEKLIKTADELIEKGVVKLPKTGLIPGKTDLSLLRNKLKAASSKMGETVLGSEFAKAANEAKGHLTFGGGIFGFAFVSYSLNHAFKEASEAPDGEKLSTFMHLISEEFIGFLMMQASIGPFYKICGNKYRGMSVEARKELENIVQKANSNPKITDEEIKLAKLQRDLLLKGVDREEVLKLSNKSLSEAENIAKSLKSSCKPDIKFWEKPLKFFGRILSTGLDEIQRPKYVNLPLFGRKKMPQPTLKGTLGGLGRLALIVGVISTALQKPVTSLCHKIFGEPKSYLKKENEENNNSDIKTVAKEVNTINKGTKNPSETNVLKKWTNLPTNAAVNRGNSSNKPIAQPLITNTTDKNSNNSIEIIPAASIVNNTKPAKKLYVPSIHVDNSYVQDEEIEINKKAASILKRTDSTINRLSEKLKN